jgi:hypothetical protein
MILMALLIPIGYTALALAFWRRSLLYGLAVINASIVFKIAWTLAVSDVAGALSHLPAALLGLAVCDSVILYLLHRMRKQPSSKPLRQANEHGG